MKYSVLGETVSSLKPTPDNCDLQGVVEHCNCHLYVLRPLDLEQEESARERALCQLNECF